MLPFSSCRRSLSLSLVSVAAKTTRRKTQQNHSDQSPPHPWHLAGYAPSGNLRIVYDTPDDPLIVGYSYDPLTGNSNGLSLAYLYGDRTQPGTTLGKYVSYYGRTDYDTEWIRAAFAGSKTPGFSNQMMIPTDTDFSALGDEGRHAAIRWGIVVLKVWIFVVESLEEAAGLCETSRADALRRWDGAVGAFAGSVPIARTPTHPDEGYFVYNLIETECRNFGTCGGGDGLDGGGGDDGYISDGMAALNREILTAMNNGREALSAGGCPIVRELAQRLVELLLIPLVQGTLRSAYSIDNHDNYSGWIQGQAGT